ncbi:MAG: 30S ribosomal protein S20 [Candidatus Eisenbacteria bacterium]
MSHHKSAIKRIRQDKKKKLRNKADKSAVKTAAKRVRQTSNPEDAAKLMPATSSIIDRAAKKRVIHWRTAARLKSRLAKRAKARPS